MNKHFAFQPEQSVTNIQSLDMTKEEKMAQVIVDASVLQYHKKRLMNEIDRALTSGNKDKFHHLSTQYNQLLEQFAHVH
ncbi:IDEAL domain-containing protein [Sutcliffiella halmapala]|uniref:IDEAL domain-containing protein n=1 Tax=Sutcliffiella halmapala TaxID=79882 RepID=UPI000994FBE9|nr:IDEAL domain-containing protein [Sutcliffiella halmapala]